MRQRGAYTLEIASPTLTHGAQRGIRLGSSIQM